MRRHPPLREPFRLAALRAGLELQPGTSPPVLRPVPGLAPARTVPERLDVVRGYLRLLGPATPKHVAGYLDAPVKDVQARWPEDAVEVDVDGEARWLLAEDADRLSATRPAVTRLLGPFDLFLQARDRSLLVRDAAHAKDLWRTLGRPGAVLADGEIVGTWRPRKSGSALTVAVDLWSSPTRRPARGGRRAGRAARRLPRPIRLKAVDRDGLPSVCVSPFFPLHFRNVHSGRIHTVICGDCSSLRLACRRQQRQHLAITTCAVGEESSIDLVHRQARHPPPRARAVVVPARSRRWPRVDRAPSTYFDADAYDRRAPQTDRRCPSRA